MKISILATSVLAISGALTIPVFAAKPTDEFKTKAGVLKLTPIQHASFTIEAGGKVIQVDPAMGDFTGAPAADIILITDIHGDHLAPANIAKLKKPGTMVIIPAAAQKDVPDGVIMKNGETKTVGAFTFEAIPMYNIKRGPAEGKLYHDKGRGNGYVVTYGGLRIYISGDTENTPEMRALKNIDVALVCMNLPYTMPVDEAADAVKAFHPKVVYPYHYMGQDVNQFAAALKGTGIDVRLRNWY
jgi:L-ascorbate metabolism protein UlaG (beta-lactamase superfamily)